MLTPQTNVFIKILMSQYIKVYFWITLGHHLPSNEIALVKIVDTKKFKPEEVGQYINSLKAFKALDH